MEWILSEFSAPLILDGKKVRVTPSLGVSQYPKDGLTEEELIRLADDAMYRAKQAGKNNYQFVSLERTQAQQLKTQKLYNPGGTNGMISNKLS